MLAQPIMESVTALTAIALWVRLEKRSTGKRREDAAQRIAEAKA